MISLVEYFIDFDMLFLFFFNGGDKMNRSFGLDKYAYKVSTSMETGNELICVEFENNSDPGLLEITNGIDNADFSVFLEGVTRQVKRFSVSSTHDRRPVVVVELLPATYHTDFSKYLKEK